MLVYRAGIGDGEYPVWIGRNANAQVVSLVADMLLLNDAEPLPPAPASAARQIPPPAARVSAAGPPATPRDLGAFVDAIITGPEEGPEETDLAALGAARIFGEQGREHLDAEALADYARADELDPGEDEG